MKDNQQKQEAEIMEFIKANVRSGDHKVVAQILECQPNYVAMVLRGERKSEKVVMVSKMLIENRIEFIKTLKQFNYKK